jgi:hypothetical protein
MMETRRAETGTGGTRSPGMRRAYLSKSAWRCSLICRTTARAASILGSFDNVPGVYSIGATRPGAPGTTSSTNGRSASGAWLIGAARPESNLAMQTNTLSRKAARSRTAVDRGTSEVMCRDRCMADNILWLFRQSNSPLVCRNCGIRRALKVKAVTFPNSVRPAP